MGMFSSVSILRRLVSRLDRTDSSLGGATIRVIMSQPERKTLYGKPHGGPVSNAFLFRFIKNGKKRRNNPVKTTQETSLGSHLEDQATTS